MSRISVDDARLQQVGTSISAMKSDVDRERTWLATTQQQLQPSGQVWRVADRMVDAWDQRLRALAQWYDTVSADLGAFGANVETARGFHGLAEETASDLAKKVMG
jgi:hypothetical protein